VGRPGRVFEPDPSRAKDYAEWFAIYRDLYAAAAGVHHRLFDRFVG
jgi:sugar (pentulose or hexulose) kinase